MRLPHEPKKRKNTEKTLDLEQSIVARVESNRGTFLIFLERLFDLRLRVRAVKKRIEPGPFDYFGPFDYLANATG